MTTPTVFKLHHNTLLIATALLAAACAPKDAGNSSAPASTGAAAASGVKPTGTVITVKMIADEKGSRFEPSEIVAHRGDVIRFTLVVGVHNIHFLADSNVGVPNLPDASDMLQLPDQTYDLPVNFAAGKTYYFQCDPHFPLGMFGHLKVTE